VKEVDVETLRSALAELEDAKLRLRRDNERQLELLKANLLAALLPVLDNLERSMTHAAADDPLLAGVKMVHQQLLGTLGQFGLERRSAVGERFDPRRHDAVAIVPVDEPAKDGVVVDELEPAYVFGDRVVRPAKVQVGRAADRPAS
jgi:molecular chaperone GrpE (heat shock protein)